MVVATDVVWSKSPFLINSTLFMQNDILSPEIDTVYM